MRVRRIHCVALLAALFACFHAGAARAATCGVPDPQTKTTPRATLTLDDDSVTSIAYKRSTAPQTFLLRFRVTGCDVPFDAAAPSFELAPKQNTANVPTGAVKLDHHLADGAEYSVRLNADPKTFNPGSYGGFVELRAAYMVTTRTPIALSRSESSHMWPILLGTIGGIVGVAWFLALNFFAKGAKTKIKVWHYVMVFVAAAIAGILVVENAYRAQEVWTLGENSISALVAAFTGATTGTMLTALAVLFPEPPQEPPAGTDPPAAVQDAERVPAMG